MNFPNIDPERLQEKLIDVLLHAATREDVKYELGKLDIKTQEGFSRLEAKIEKLEVKIDGIESRLEAKIDGVESRLEAKIEKLEAKIDGIESRLEAKIDGVESRLEEKIKELGDRIKALELKLEHIYKFGWVVIASTILVPLLTNVIPLMMKFFSH